MFHKLLIIDLIACLTVLFVLKFLVWARGFVKSPIGKSDLDGAIVFVGLLLILFLLCIPAILISAIWSM